MYIKCQLSHVMCPFETRTAHSHGPFRALGHKMTNDTKRRQLQDARDSSASSGTRTGGKYEVVAGARRLRAAKLAELEKLPVRVVKLTDAEAIEAQCVENLQREDIHPLEEALGFKSLLELGEPAYNIATIA